MGISLNAGNWLTIAAVALFCIGNVVHGMITRPRKEEREVVKEIHEHTVNTHSTNMRADLDKAIAISAATEVKVDQVLKELAVIRRDVSDHGGAIGEIKGELRHLRK